MTSGSLSGTNATLGKFAGSTGTATISGGTWNAYSIVTGDAGTGVLNMNGGLVIVTANMTRGTLGTINLNAGGTLQIGNGSTLISTLLGGTGNLTNNGTLIFNRTGSFTHSGEISGTGVFERQGASGTLTLSGNNSFSGGTKLTGGTVSLGHANAIGTSGTVSFGGGTLQYSASNATDYSDRFSNAASQQYKVDTNSQNVTLASNLTSSGGSFTKLGAGTLTISGINTYNGATTVSAGQLTINGSIANSTTTVSSGATLGGSGTVGALTINSGGFVNPGNSPGILTVNGNYSQAGRFTAEIAGTTAGVGYDQIDVIGAVNITGGNLVTLFSGSYSANDTMFILLNDGADAINGTYTGFAQGATVASYGGFDWLISYNANSSGNTFTGGNDIALMAAIPEPSIAALASCFAVFTLLRRRR